MFKYKDIKSFYEKKGIDPADIDWVFVNVFKIKRSSLFDLTFSKEELINVENYLKKLEKNIPLQYIFKEAYFYSRIFEVNYRVLIPRQETEELIYNALKIIKNDNEIKNILDIGTGSGIIAITLKKELEYLNVCASDISEFALNVARNNARKLDAKITFIKSNVLESLNDDYEVIISNPPYITEKDYESLDNNVRLYEPKLALTCKEEGFEIYKKIYEQSKNYKKLKYLIFEIGINQENQIKEIFKEYKNISVIKDMHKINRIMIISR